MSEKNIFGNSNLRGSFMASSLEEVFENQEEMIAGIFGLLDFISRYFQEDKIERQDIFLTKLKVVFTNNVEDVELDTGVFDNTLTIKAPQFKKEKEEERNKRRIELLNHFIQSVQDSQLKTVVFLYTTLSRPSREQLVLKFQTQSQVTKK